jgi:hypothetical protein
MLESICLHLKKIKMFDIKRQFQCLLLMSMLSWFAFGNCMNADVNLSSAIVKGDIESVTKALSEIEDVNKTIYCEEIKQLIEPLSLAIICLNKVEEIEAKHKNILCSYEKEQ